MSRILQVLIAALATLALCVPLAFADDSCNHDEDEPEVCGLPATGVTDGSAVLRATVDPEGDDDDSEWAAYRFQYGTTTGYGFTTEIKTFKAKSERTVEIQVDGLQPATTYHFRAVASNDDHDENDTTYGPNRSFTTAQRATDSGAPAPEPALGRTVVAGTTSGEVFVRERGSHDFHPLSAAESIPINSVLDTRDGTVALETALPKGKSQTGTFRGGMFKVHQSRKGKGMTHIALRGGNFASCKRGKADRAQPMFRKRRKKRAIRKLWAKDKGGRFKTSGKGSVATVRGTTWYTADSCNGTVTRVKEGAVLVRERGSKRRKLVKQGQKFFARTPHKHAG